MNRVLLACLTVLAGGAALTGCTTLGGNVKGSFSCVAPDGICAPSSRIDDRALAMIAGEDGDRMIAPASPYSAPSTEGRTFDTAGATPARSQERVLRIVFPAQIDAAGRLHEQTAVHAVVERGEWQRTLASNAVATASGQVQAATGGDTLLAAVDHANAPMVSGADVVADPDMPSAAAVAAARAQPDPVGDIKEQVARRLASKPRLSVNPSVLQTPPALTVNVRPVTAPTATPAVKAAMLSTTPTPIAISSSAPARLPESTTAPAGITVPARATAAGRTTIGVVASNPDIRSGLAQAEPEAREAAKSADPLPVLHASSFPGVDQ